MNKASRIWLAFAFLLMFTALYLLNPFQEKPKPKTASPASVQARVQFVVDSVRVQQLARELASKSGDSLRIYWMRHWSKRVHKGVDTLLLESVDTLTQVQIDTLYRESIVQSETCEIALDSNRIALSQTLTALDDCEKKGHPSIYKYLTALGSGMFLGRMSCLDL